MKKKSKSGKDSTNPMSKRLTEDEEISDLLERIQNAEVECGSQPIQ